MTRSPTFSPAAETTTPPQNFGPAAPRPSPPGPMSPGSSWLHNHAYRRASLSPSRFPTICRCQVDGAHRSPASSLGGEAQELPRHRIDLDEICRDLLIAAALSGDRTEAPAREPLRRTCVAEMNYRGELLRLLPAGRSFWPVRADCRSVAVQKHRRQLDGAARGDPRTEPG